MNRTARAFNEKNLPSDLTGDPQASVLFAQNQIMPSKNRIPGDVQPHLTGNRKTLVLLKPEQTLSSDFRLDLDAFDADGQLLGQQQMNTPDQLAKTAYYVELNPQPGGTAIIFDQVDLKKLEDETGAFLIEELKDHALVDISTADGRYVKDIYLPLDKSLERKVVSITSHAALTSVIRAVLLNQADGISIRMWNGRYKEGIYLPLATAANKDQSIRIEHDATYDTTLHLNGTSIIVSPPTKRTYVSNGDTWLESEAAPAGLTERIPSQCNVAVATLVGFYDPDADLRSYIYPALHGTDGLTCPDDSHRIGVNDWQLQAHTFGS